MPLKIEMVLKSKVLRRSIIILLPVLSNMLNTQSQEINNSDIKYTTMHNSKALMHLYKLILHKHE